MLLTPLALVTGDFIYLHHEAHEPVRTDESTFRPIPCTEGDKYIDGGHLVWWCQNGVLTESVPPDATLGPPVPFNPNAPYGRPINIDLSAGLVPKPSVDLFGEALPFGLYGIPAGLGLWVLYRVIRFAITG